MGRNCRSRKTDTAGSLELPHSIIVLKKHAAASDSRLGKDVQVSASNPKITSRGSTTFLTGPYFGPSTHCQLKAKTQQLEVATHQRAAPHRQCHDHKEVPFNAHRVFQERC